MAAAKTKRPTSKLKAGKKKKINKWLLLGGVATAIVVGIITVRLSSAATISGCPSPYNITLQRGSTGNCVKHVQRLLNYESGARLTVDGKYGPATEAAVKNYQRFFKLSVTGKVDRRTYDTLQYINVLNCRQGKPNCYGAG